MPEEPIIHVYAQECWHDDAYIVANEEGLLALKKAVDEALEKGKGDAFVYTADGEEFTLLVLRIDGGLGEGKWPKIAMPYTDKLVSEERPDALWPSNLMGRPKTR